jgi:hypothetical protein
MALAGIGVDARYGLSLDQIKRAVLSEELNAYLKADSGQWSDDDYDVFDGERHTSGGFLKCAAASPKPTPGASWSLCTG